MKAFTLRARATFKDYIDLYYTLKESSMTLENLIKGCQARYKEEFNARLFLGQLIYFKDIEKRKIEFLKDKVK
jgi:hypothetical protein